MAVAPEGKTAPEWEGFPERLKYAVAQRMRERGCTQNEIAALAKVDSGNFSKLLGDPPEKWRGLKANSLIWIARALEIEPLWLLLGVEPSGLARRRERDSPESEVRPASSRP